MSASQGTARERNIRLSRILAPTDFSPGATKALHWAVAVKTAFHAELVVLHVVDLDDLAYMNLGGDPTYQLVSVELMDRIRSDVEQAMSRVTESFPGIQPMVRDGTPREIILQVAKELGTNLIVMGTHGRSGLARVAFGSVAGHIIRHSKAPVLAVREPEAA